ncbi:MAG: HDIG domain-containing metalloprotein [Clostridia bacterium]
MKQKEIKKLIKPDRENGEAKRHFYNIVIIFVYSLTLPFLLALLQTLVGAESITDTFDNYYKFFVVGGMLFIVFMLIEKYIHIRWVDLMKSTKQLCFILLAVAITYVFSILFGAYISVYTMPLLLSGLLISILVERRIALVSNVLINIVFFFLYTTLVPYADIYAVLGAVFINALAGSFLIMLLRNAYIRLKIFVNGIIVGIVVSVPTAILITLITEFSPIDILTNSLWVLVSMFLDLALFMILMPVFENIFNLYSNFRLEEICSPEYPAMKELEKKAPGTYNHSLAVSNLAQACAMAIGESPVLAKACACYHDYGKIKNPLCFIENQKGYNPHDDYIPEVSVRMITEHTTFGAKLLKEMGLPAIIRNVAIEHHGTTEVRYFYNKAKNITDEELEQKEFAYGGPIPQTKMAGIIMITDTVEAATRAQGIEIGDGFRVYIHSLIQSKVNSGQFNECPLTHKDIQVIEDTLVRVVPSFYHQRIKYSEEKK